MFQKTRIKLTVWYLLIIMFVSTLFSMAIYTGFNHELERWERVRQFRLERTDGDFPGVFRRFPPSFDESALSDTRMRFLLILFGINGAVLLISGLAGYFLAGRTLKPIKEMVDEQNRFITDASHELRTPLTSLKTSIEVYLRGRQHTVKESDKLLSSNLEEVNDLQSLSDNLIKLTQYQQTNGNIVFENTSLAEIIEETLKKVSNLAKHKNITIKNQIKGYTIEADKQSLSEAFVIFLDNAIKYSPKNTSVTLRSKNTDHFVVVDVKDEGVGIHKEDMPYLFDRFYRADKSRTKLDVEGFGLGLSIAKQIIEKHNGTISVESKLGIGTTFSIQLPVKHLRRIL